MLFKGREVAYHLKDSDAVAIIAFQGTPDLPIAQMVYDGFKDVPSCKHMIVATVDPAAAPPVEGEGVTTLGRTMAGQPPVFDTVQTMPDETAVILYTSGTTGSPKGAELTQANMVMNALVTRDMVGFNKNDVALAVLPLFHSFGQTVIMNTAFTVGGDDHPAAALYARCGPGHSPTRQCDDLCRRADHVLGADELSRGREIRPGQDPGHDACGGERRRSPAVGGDQGFRGQVRRADSGRLWPERDLTRGLLQPARPAAEGWLDRPARFG